MAAGAFIRAALGAAGGSCRPAALIRPGRAGAVEMNELDCRGVPERLSGRTTTYWATGGRLLAKLGRD